MIKATHKCKYNGLTLYFIKAKCGFRQVKENLIMFFDSGIDESLIKPIKNDKI